MQTMAAPQIRRMPLWRQEPRNPRNPSLADLETHPMSIRHLELLSLLIKQPLPIPTGPIDVGWPPPLRGSQGKLFDMARQAYPGRFNPGVFASCDYFIEILLDPKQHPKNNHFQNLFAFLVQREFSCEAHPHIKQASLAVERQHHVLSITSDMFGEARLSYDDVGKLLNLWETSGLPLHSGRVCKSCSEPKPLFKPPTPTKKKRSKKPKITRVGSEIEVLGDYINISRDNQHYLLENSRLHFQDNLPPLHLNIHLDVTSIQDETSRRDFMDGTDWPFKLTLGGYVYTLIARGFWTRYHYWGKVLQTSAGMTGVWLHNNADNHDYAQLINRVPGSIAGKAPHTSWLLYSRTWTPSETQFMEESIQKIQRDNPNPVGELPFLQTKALLHSSYGSVAIPYDPNMPQEPMPASPSNPSTSLQSNQPTNLPLNPPTKMVQVSSSSTLTKASPALQAPTPASLANIPILTLTPVSAAASTDLSVANKTDVCDRTAPSPQDTKRDTERDTKRDTKRDQKPELPSDTIENLPKYEPIPPPLPPKLTLKLKRTAPPVSQVLPPHSTGFVSNEAPKPVSKAMNNPDLRASPLISNRVEGTPMPIRRSTRAKQWGCTR
ncbi:hypothetical protein PSTG_03120 [Puccinia striiformis f. sp. tritici PST-78]|uniref:Uncharacterized protein n=2 Tax=Puccinia striiformis f. sp. tritici TaxID=168172 RepID=A0A0L0VWN6_9BASI|nr:hypothetical protein PSTG_03120 [Puccinia striiformis f. sp. tritici PST-78]